MPFFKPARSIFFTLAALSVAFAAGADDRAATQETSMSEPAADAAPPSPSALPFDASAMARRLQLAYRAEPDGFHGGHATYDVHVTDEGLTLTPMAPGAPAEPEPSALPSAAPVAKAGAPLVLGAARVRRGDTRVDSGAPRGAVQPGGDLAVARGAVVEHLHNGEAGVEQSWSFDAEPEGDGELVVDIPAEGLTYTQATETGLHFADVRTGLGFQYGHGTWIDARGQRTAIRAEYMGGHIHLRVPESVIEGSAYPAVLDPVISTEMIVDGRLTAAEAKWRQSPAIAFNGTTFLLLWEVLRGNNSNVYGARISESGHLLDPVPFPVATGPGVSIQPRVASNGADFYVVWAQRVATSWEVRGTRVSASGEVAVVGGQRLTEGPGTVGHPRVASNGTDYLVVWSAGPSVVTDTHDVHARRVSAAGEMLGSDILVAADPTCGELTPSVASNGDGYLVAWNGGHFEEDAVRAYAALLSSEGAVQGAAFPLGGDTLQHDVAVASNGEDYLAVWLDYRAEYGRDLYGTRVTAGGTVVDPGGLPIGTSDEAQESTPAVGSDGTDYFVAWTSWHIGANQFRTMGSRVSASLPGQQAVVDAPGFLFSPLDDHRNPAVSWSGRGYLIVWDGLWADAPEERQIWEQWIPGESARPLALPGLSYVHQSEEAVASNGEGYLVVWTETTPSSISIRGARVSVTGALVDPTPLNIATAPRERGMPAVASNGQDYLVTWMDYRGVNWDIFGARVSGSAAGQAAVLDPDGIRVSQHPEFQNSPAVASDGTDYLVVWRQASGGRGDVHAARVTSAGAVLDSSGIAVATNVAEHYTPRVASNGAGYLVVWAEYRGATSWDILGKRLSGQGALLDASPIVVTGAAREQHNPDVASDGTDYLVVWMDYRSNTSTDVYGARVTAGGAALDPAGIAISAAPAQQVSPKVAFDGTGYVALWAENPHGAWNGNTGRVTISGQATALTHFYMALEGPQSTVSLTSAGEGHGFIAYSRADAAPDGVRRVRGAVASF